MPEQLATCGLSAPSRRHSNGQPRTGVPPTRVPSWGVSTSPRQAEGRGSTILPLGSEQTRHGISLLEASLTPPLPLFLFLLTSKPPTHTLPSREAAPSVAQGHLRQGGGGGAGRGGKSLNSDTGHREEQKTCLGAGGTSLLLLLRGSDDGDDEGGGDLHTKHLPHSHGARPITHVIQCQQRRYCPQ